MKADSRHDGDVPVYGSNGEVDWRDKRLVQGPSIVIGAKENPGVVTEGAKVLGVSRQTLSNLVNCHTRISADMAVRLAKASGSTTETWIRLQAAYAVEQAQAQEGEIDVEHYEPQPVAVGSLAIVDDRDDGIPT